MYSNITDYIKEMNLKDFNDIAFVCNEMAGTCSINDTQIKRLILYFDKIEDIQKVINSLEGLKFILSYDYNKESGFFSSKEEK